MKKLAIVLLGMGMFPSTRLARAEGLDEAVGRLCKAADGLRDLSVKWQFRGGIGNKEGESQVLRDGKVRLIRSLTQYGDSSQELYVFDGQFLWREARSKGSSGPTVVKEGIGTHPLTLRTRVGMFDCVLGANLGDLRKFFDTIGPNAYDIKLLGRGKVGARSSTTIEVTPKLGPSSVAGSPLPVRVVDEYDDATGALLSHRSTSGKGEVEELTTTEIKADSGLPRDLFQYAVPKGAKVFGQ